MEDPLLCSKWDLGTLNNVWNSMFDKNYYRVHNDNLDTQGLYLLLEGAFLRVQQLANRFSDTTASHNEALIELEQKNIEIKSLKEELTKLNKCKTCNSLEIKLNEVTKKAHEAENRMKSIAKILCVGNLDTDDFEKRNSALTIVSQMLLDSSPKRKRQRHQLKISPLKEKLLVPASVDINTENLNGKKNEDENIANEMVPETMDHSPLKTITNMVLKTSPKKNREETSNLRNSLNLSSDTPKVSTVKKNLSADYLQHEFVEKDVIDCSPPDKKKILSFNIDLENVLLKKSSKNTSSTSDSSLDTTSGATSLRNVKDSRLELDKIWFEDDVDDTFTNADTVQKISTHELKDVKPHSPVNEIIEVTPLRETVFKKERKKQADFWILKEKNELSIEIKNNPDKKKLRQTKLELGVKQKNVDISTLAGFKGGLLVNNEEDKVVKKKTNGNDEEIIDKDEEIIPGSPTSLQLYEGRSGSTIELETTTNFRPMATSTQVTGSSLLPMNDNDDLSTRTKTSEIAKEFVYKRDAIKGKSDRAKLPGWNCYECKNYYKILSLSPSKVKDRMNACSRHRDKFKPRANTPPDFWNPLFPDTQECREKGMYTSIYESKK